MVTTQSESVAKMLLARYGAWAILVAVALGATIWGLSHYAAAQGTTVSVLWGMTSYVKGGAGAPAASCKSLQGRWQRGNDYLVYNLTQTGCVLTGFVESSTGTNSHEIHAMVAGNRATGYIRRVYNGCSTFLATDYELITDNRLEIRNKGYGCDLGDNWPDEDKFYIRLP